MRGTTTQRRSLRGRLALLVAIAACAFAALGTSIALAESGKTDVPTIPQSKVMAAKGNVSAEFTVTNTDAYTGKEITVEVYEGDDFSQKDENVKGEYAQGKLTLTFTPPIEEQKTYQVTFQASEEEKSENSVTLTVDVYAPTMTVNAALNGSPLTQGTEAAGVTIVLTATGDAKFAAIDGAADGKYVLQGSGADGIKIVSVKVDDEGKSATLTLGGTPTKAGELQVKVTANAFEPVAAAEVISSNSITVNAAPSVTLTAQPISVGEKNVTFVAERSNFNGATVTGGITLKNDGGTGAVLGIHVSEGVENKLTITLQTAPTKSGTITFLFTKESFNPVASEDVEVEVEVNPAQPEATLTGTSTLQAGKAGGTITLTAKDAIFADPADVENFTLSDTNLSVQGVKVSNDGTTATLTVNGTPKETETVIVTVVAAAFKPEASADATAKVTVAAAPTITLSGASTLQAGVDGGTITLTPKGGEFGANPSKGLFALSDKNLKVGKVEVSKDGVVTLTVTGTPSKSGDITVTVQSDAFVIAPAKAVAATVAVKAAAPETGTPSNPNPGYVGWDDGTGSGSQTGDVGAPSDLVDAIEQAKPGTEFQVNLPTTGQQITFTADAPVPEDVKVSGAVLGFPEAKSEGAVTTTYNPTAKAFTLTAQPVKGYRFVRWTLARQAVSSANPWQVTMAAPSSTEAQALAATSSVAPGAYVAVFEEEAPAPMTVKVYRIQNPDTNEHLYTADTNEYSYWTNHGWVGEDVAWTAPVSSTTPIYRLRYEGAGGGHLYTADVREYNHLDATDEWVGEGVAMYGADSTDGVPVYRLYEPTYPLGISHLWTADFNEYTYQGDHGWQREDVAFYAVTAPGLQ